VCVCERERYGCVSVRDIYRDSSFVWVGYRWCMRERSFLWMRDREHVCVLTDCRIR
jgi:hypothetical protein